MFITERLSLKQEIENGGTQERRNAGTQERKNGEQGTGERGIFKMGNL